MTMAAMLTVGPSLAVIGAVFFAGDAIAGEYESKTGFLLFINPIKRCLTLDGEIPGGFYRYGVIGRVQLYHHHYCAAGDIPSGSC